MNKHRKSNESCGSWYSWWTSSIEHIVTLLLSQVTTCTKCPVWHYQTWMSTYQWRLHRSRFSHQELSIILVIFHHRHHRHSATTHSQRQIWITSCMDIFRLSAMDYCWDMLYQMLISVSLILLSKSWVWSFVFDKTVQKIYVERQASLLHFCLETIAFWGSDEFIRYLSISYFTFYYLYHTKCMKVVRQM